MKKFIKVFTLSVLMLVLGTALVACNKDSLKGITGNATVSVVEGASVEVALTLDPVGYEGELEVAVADTKVATAVLKEGKVAITGVKEGSTTVTVSAKKNSAIKHEVAVTVTKAEVVPTTGIVTFNVTIPADTPAGLDIYVVGNFPVASWSPGHDSLKMTKLTDTTYTFQIELDLGYELEYKYVSGKDWDHGEKGKDQLEIDNRKLTVANNLVVTDVVVEWNKLIYGTKTLRGITDTEILIGNTVPVGGAMAFIGQPFTAGIEVALRAANAENDGKGLGGRQIKLVNRDDGGDGTTGTANTAALVEQDKVFAIVGHFGATVDPTVQYLTDNKVPMFYAANGTNKLYQENSVGNPILPVQPIGMTDGRMMLARALSNPIHGANGDEKLNLETAKVGVLHTSDQGALDMLAGVEREAEILGLASSQLIKQVFDYLDAGSITSAVAALLAQKPDVILLPLSQNPYKAILPGLEDAENKAPTYTSYFNANLAAISVEKPSYALYSNAWIDITSPAGWDEALVFVEAIMADTKLTAEEKALYSGDSFAMAGYIAGSMFVESIRRMGEIETSEFSVEAYVAKLEEQPIHIPMGGNIDFSNGQRLGVTALSLLLYVPATETDPAAQVKVEDLTEISALEKIITGK